MLAVSLAGSIAGSASYPFMGIWAIKELHAAQTKLAFTFGSTWSVGWALTPFLGLQVRSAYGDATMWMCVAAVGVIAGILGVVAARGHDGNPAAVGSPA